VSKPPKKIAQKQLALRNRLWPGLQEGLLWHRRLSHGFTNIPRTMPLMMSIMDDLSKGKPVSAAYLDLWCRAFDESFVVLSRSREMAFHAGFDGQRGERTWRERIKILAELSFISLKEGPSGPMSYALIHNPYLVIKWHHAQKTPGLVEAKYSALLERALEIGAADLDDEPPAAGAAA
jgi:hypothetical protein